MHREDTENRMIQAELFYLQTTAQLLLNVFKISCIKVYWCVNQKGYKHLFNWAITSQLRDVLLIVNWLRDRWEKIWHWGIFSSVSVPLGLLNPWTTFPQKTAASLGSNNIISHSDFFIKAFLSVLLTLSICFVCLFAVSSQMNSPQARGRRHLGYIESNMQASGIIN